MEQVTTFRDFLVLFGLVVNFIVLVLALKKVGILENIFMIHWKQATLGLVLTMFAFLVWFIAEIIESLSEILYEQLLIICFFMLSLGQMIYLLILHRR